MPAERGVTQNPFGDPLLYADPNWKIMQSK